MAEIASAYVSLIPSLRGAGKIIGKELDSPEVKRAAEKAGESSGTRMGAGLKTALVAGAALAAAAAGAVIAKGIGDALEREKLGDKVAASLGLSESESKRAGSVAGKLYADAYGESMGDVTDAVGTVMSSIDGMATASPKRLEAVTGSVLNIASAFDLDVSEAARNVGILMKTGLAKDATGAMDLITASMQKVPTALRGEVTDATQEYSQFFSALGFTGPQAMGLLVSATEDGQYGIDKMGDSIKEFSIRSTDMSKTTTAAYEALGLNSKTTTADLLAGGDRAKGAFDKIIGGLKGMKDPAAQSQAALALFGTPLEDLGTSEIPAFLDGLSGTKSALTDVKGAAKDMGDTLNDNLSTQIESLKRRAEVFVSDGLMAMIDGFRDGKGTGDGFAGVMSNIGATVRDVTDWMRENKDMLLLIASTVGGATLAWGAYTLATKAWSTATTIATVIAKGFNAALRANPIGIVVTAIGALVGALVYLYENNETVRKAIDAAWAWIKGAIKSVADWWTTTAWPAIKVVITAMGAAFTRAKDAIVLAWNRIKAGISAVWQWIQKWVFLPIRLYIDLLKQAFGLLKTGAVTAWNGIKTGLGAAWTWIRDNVFAPIKTGVGLVKAAFSAAKEGISTAWDGVKTAVGNVWTWIRDNVFSKFKTGVEGIQTAFENVKDGIKSAWDALKAIAAKPVNFILGTVYNDGIRKWWNNIAGAVGLTSLKLPMASEVKFASGGVMPGYTPGRDVHHFSSPTGGNLHLSGGEAIMRPEWTRAVGGPSAVAAMNSAARRGQAFKDGGVWGWLKNTAGDTWDGIKNIGKGIWDAGAMAVEILKDPVGAIKKALVDGIIKPALANSGAAGDFVKVIGELPGKFAGGLADKVKAMLGAQASSEASGPGSWSGKGLGVARMTQIAQGLVPGTQITSGFRPGAVAAVGLPSMHASGRAIDMVGPDMGRIFDAIKKNYPNSKEIIYSPKNGQQVYKGKPYFYPEPTRGMHSNHVHWGYKGGGVIPATLHDQGGWLPHGGLGVNLSGKPEAVLDPDESAALKAGLTGDQYTIYAADLSEAIRELEARRRRNITQRRLGAGR